MCLKNKTTIIFLTTFLIGYVSVLPSKNNINKIEIQQETIDEKIIDDKVLVEIKKETELETIEEVSFWFEETYPYKIKLLETGDGFHGQEIDAKNGETWLGLFENNGQYYLRSAKLKIRNVHDPIADEIKSKKTGKSVEVINEKVPVFLIKNAPTLKEGKVSTLFGGVTWNEYINKPELKDLYSDEVLTKFKKEFTQNYKIHNEVLKLSVIEAKNKDGDKLLALELKSGEKRQILHTVFESNYAELGILYWVGDLDRDGKPDFFLELYEHDNVDNKVLFLSSEAEKGNFVKKVAYFWTTGC